MVSFEAGKKNRRYLDFKKDDIENLKKDAMTSFLTSVCDVFFTAFNIHEFGEKVAIPWEK